jgi:hypothetical protein
MYSKLIENLLMTELHCTYDSDDCLWLVWFPHPLGGMNVLDSFDNESDARAYWQEQIDTADYSQDTE